MEKLLLCFLFKTQHKGCFDVLLVTLFSSLSTRNFIIGTEKKKKKGKTTKNRKKMQIGLDYFIFRRYSICMPAGMLVWQHPIPESALLALAQAMCASSWGICLYTMAHSHTGRLFPDFPWPYCFAFLTTVPLPPSSCPAAVHMCAPLSGHLARAHSASAWPN